jgi:nifR3 family TIM-barrel protein
MKFGNIDIDKPVYLAPMEDVTDIPFRKLCKKFGADIMITEFVSSDALIRNVKKTMDKMTVLDYERPIGVQIYGHDYDTMVEAAKIVESVNPDFIDLNFGCPVKKIVRRGAGSAMLKTPELLVKIAKGVADAVKVPVTVKTRIGWDKSSVNIVEVVKMLQDTGIKVITIHARTREQMYSGQADWLIISKVTAIPGLHTYIVGNGDIDSAESAAEKFEKFGVDGIMIGRAAIGAPWIFKNVKEYLIKGNLLPEPTTAEKVSIAIEHLNENVNFYGERVGVLLMRRHYAKYFKGLDNFRDTKIKLLTSPSYEENLNILRYIAERWGSI